MHPSIIGNSGHGISMRRVFPVVSSTIHKLDTKSFTETKIVAVDYCMSSVLRTRYFLGAEGYDVFENIVYQDNKSDILLENNGKASSSSAQST